MDLQNQMKQAVALAAVDQIENGMILGLGSGSTAALMIEALAMKIKSGEINYTTGPYGKKFEKEFSSGKFLPMISDNFKLIKINLNSQII